MSITILVVEDFLPWQGVIKAILGSQNDLNIIATASGGLEAIQKAQELKPDLILMDVSLPGMSGFEVARQIRIISPVFKILFLSERRGSDFIKAAFEVGGSGYVLKSDARADLLIGIRVILRGRQFVSRSLIDRSNATNGEDPSLI